MATGGTPNGRDKNPTGRMSSFSEPRPNKRPAPRFDTSLDTELSLNTELRRSEDSTQLNHRSLPNNLGWSLGTGSNMAERLTPTGGQKKAKPFEHVILQEASSPDSSSQPSGLRRKKHHTPATIPRTKLPAGTPKAERDALARLRQQLNFEEEIPTRGPRKSAMQDVTSRSSAANNERSIRSPGSQVIPVQESYESDTALANDRIPEVANDKVNTMQILERLRQVRDFLKQATEMFVTMSFEGNEEQMTKEYEQAAILHRLIKHLKNQEKAYTDLLERTLAIEGDLTTENTPSASVQSVSDDEKGETPSIREEELQGLRQQHALLQKMLEQQRQLKELQSRQAALLTLQRDAEQRLAEAEGEDDEGAVGGYDTVSGRSRTDTDASQLSLATTEFSTADDSLGLNPELLALQNFVWRSKEKQTAHLRNEKDRDDSIERRPKKNQPPSNTHVGVSADLQSASDGQPDNEEAALAIADAAQERLELENKLMALQAKREQMDSLLNELQLLREAQLRKESIEARKPHVSSVNVAKKDNSDEKPLATTSQKLDDDSILEAFEVHQKLKRLQDLRQHLYQIRDMIGQREEEVGLEAIANAEDSAPESGRNGEEEDAVGGVTSPGQDNSNVDWILNHGFEDPEIITKLRQLQAARERVMNLKQTNQTVQLPAGTSRYHNETNNQQLSQSQTEESDTDATTTDTESNASSSVNAMAWQDDPEFQDKIRKLKSAKTKLKQLQELVKRVHQFPDSAPVLPTELAELSFDDDDEDDDDEQDESSESDYDDDDGNKEDANQDSESTSLQDEQSRGLPRDTVSDQEAEYQICMQKQKNELARLLEERERLMEMQQSLSRLTQQQSNALLQTVPVVKIETTEATTSTESKPTLRNTASPSLLRTDTFTVHKPTVPVISRHMNDSSTQTTTFENPAVKKTKPSKVDSVDSIEAARAAPTSSALVWSELRRQRELHEEKLKKRKHRLLNEKRKKFGLDDVSEGGTYSLRSADVDEGFGVSMMSADITTATWGGSTQPSSTQNDSAVSEDGSETVNQEIAVEVEDDYPDGIVQAEEEEEQHDSDSYPRDVADVFRSRERVRRTFPSGNYRPPKKRGRGSKGLTFAWPKIGSDRSPRRLRQQNFIPSEGLIEEREQEQMMQERQAWEQQCGELHGEVAKLTDMCNNLLRDQQALVSALIGRTNLPGMPMASPLSANANPFSQYQQKEQNAYQSYFDQQHYLFQHQQLLQTLNRCCAQLHQQQSDISFLQGQFQQLISGNSTKSHGGLPPMADYALPSQNTFNPFKASNLIPPAEAGFPSLHTFTNPSTSSTCTNPAAPVSNLTNLSMFQRDGLSQTPPGFTPATLNQSDLRWPSGTQSATQASTSRAPSWLPVFSNPFKVPPQSKQTGYSGGPNTGVPSKRYIAVGINHSPDTSASYVALEEPIAPPPSLTHSETPTDYNPSAYAEASGAVISSTNSNKSPFVVGRSFPTPLRELAAANLASKNLSSLKRGRESIETSSQMSSVPGEAQDPSKGRSQDMDRASDAGSEFSLFEALRDSIYSEVATLISLNESRPHFLIELFRELQLLTSDYLRQRALYALRDIVTRFLTEDSITAGIVDKKFQQARFQAWVGSNSELTPSETVETSEDESRGEAEAAQIVTEGIYDYAENAESGSTLSTPTSSHTGDAPFASEGLGETVIHFDQTLSKMREYERLREQGKLSQLKRFAFMDESKGPEGSHVIKDDVTTSSAGDFGSDSSFSDVQYPRIDTQALDHQIKSIMSEVIPYLNEHMEDTCSKDLLGYVQGLVLSRIQVRDEQEFGRFFHKQLASILQDSLSKFENKKMKDCGEDMLVDMSEILFNELAFFKLMQDLDGFSARSREPFWRQESQSGTDTGTGQEADKEDDEQEDEKPEDSATEETESTMREKSEENIEQKDGDTDNSDDDSSSSSSSEDSVAEDGAEEDGPVQISQDQNEAEEEGLGKERDDNMAAQFEDMPESSKDSQAECVKLELSVSESRPFTSAGSGEEDGEESYDDLQSKRMLEDCEGGTAAAGRDSTDSDGSDAPQDDQLRPEHLHNDQVQEEHDEVVIDDLPTKLTGLTEADLQARIAEEQSRTQGTQAVLQHIAGNQELVGDPNSLSEPETTVVNGAPEGDSISYA